MKHLFVVWLNLISLVVKQLLSWSLSSVTFIFKNCFSMLLTRGYSEREDLKDAFGS